MQRFKVTGMSCAACSARVEQAVSRVEGAKNVSVNLLTGDLSVNGNAEKQEIIQAVINAGYGILTEEKAEENTADNKPLAALKRRLISSVAILVVIMYFSMLSSMFSLPLPSFLIGRPHITGSIELLLTLAVLIINRSFFINGIKGIINRAPNMDTLVSLGAAASFFYSLYILIQMFLGHIGHTGHSQFYFESAAMIVTLITVGKMLESIAKGKTTNAINSLKELCPKTATVIKDGKEVKISTEELTLDDIFIVRAGEAFPADGTVIEGSAAVDESSVTGESIPVQKNIGDSVISVTVNRNGFLKCRATAVGKESTFGKIIKTVTDATAGKAPIARLADKVSGIFVPVVIGIAVLTLIIWLVAGKNIGFALQRAISVLVISCPCALGLATPVAIMVASGVGAKHGILYKSAAALEMCGKINTVLLDKTGTITQGYPKVTDIMTDEREELLSVALSLEKNSSHPLSLAICDYARDIAACYEVSDFSEISGKGVEGTVNGELCFGGSVSAAKMRADFNEAQLEFINNIESDGKTPLVFIKGKKILGIIAACDTIKEDSKKAILMLENMNIDVIILTGDNKTTAQAIAKQVGVNNVIAEVLPDDKANIVKQYAEKSKTAMVGDGINDAPALTVADVGIAIGQGKDIASEAADVVLMKNSLLGVATALKLGQKALKNIKENLFWAFIYNCLGIPLAAGAFISLFGWELNPMFGAAAMSLSSFCVVSNALRLNFFKISKNKKEKNRMEKIIKINGMMCQHCEAHVKKALEAIPGVLSATPDHKKCEAVVVLNGEVDDAALKQAVENEGYVVTEIK